MTTVRDNLIAARALIDTPEKWVKGNFFNGCRYCAAGALRHVVGKWAGSPEWKALCWAMPVRLRALDCSPVYLNDHPNTTHADVMALFDRAIAAEKEGAAILAISSQPTQEG